MQCCQNILLFLSKFLSIAFPISNFKFGHRPWIQKTPGISMFSVIALIWMSCIIVITEASKSCNRTRVVLEQSWGQFSDGDDDYMEASHCQWLIKGMFSVVLLPRCLIVSQFILPTDSLFFFLIP